MSTQIAVRLSDELIVELDGLVQSGDYESRAEVVRRGLEIVIDLERRRRIGEAIVHGYERVPQTDDELATATANALRSIEEEPW
jgi:Arc/MetJ-type ribon-helix-helix transcriptional regulator